LTIWQFLVFNLFFNTWLLLFYPTSHALNTYSKEYKSSLESNAKIIMNVGNLLIKIFVSEVVTSKLHKI